MSRRDYILIVGVLRKCRPPAASLEDPFALALEALHLQIVDGFCEILARDNPRFSPEKFLIAVSAR